MLTLLYHNVLSDPANIPIAKTQVTLETFIRHVTKFRRRVLHPQEVHEQLIQGKVPDGILVTFDDGAAGIIEAGRALASMGKVGVAFVCPGTLRSGLWFYRLADGLTRATADRIRLNGYDLALETGIDRLKAYSLLSKELFNLQSSQRDQLLEDLLRHVRLAPGNPPPALRTLDESGLRLAAQTGGLIFANHSWSHPNLVSLSEAELAYEVGQAESWLRSSGLPTLPWFAFPRGSFDERVRKEVARFCPVAFGASPRKEDRSVLPRTFLCGLDSNAFRFALKTVWDGRLRLSLPI
jgi:hypothetical protein